MKDAELMEMQGDWQGLGDVETTVTELARRAANETGKARRSIVTEVLACATSTGFLGWMTVRAHGSVPVVVLAAGVSLFNGIYLATLFSTRRWQGSYGTHGLEAFGGLLREQLQSKSKWLRFVWRSTWVLGAGVLAWLPWWIVEHLEAYRREPWRAGVGVGVSTLILAVVLWWVKRSQRHLARAVTQLEMELGRATLE